MSSFWKKIRGVLPGLAAGAATAAHAGAATPEGAAAVAADKAWQASYEARTVYYQSTVGQLPEDILKLPQFTGVWPGGGLFVIPADKLGKGLFAYTTFGFSNPDMPTTGSAQDVKTKKDEHGRITSTSATLKAKQAAVSPEGAAGYGYELVVVARENAEWPLWILQWAANAELGNDVGLLKRVEKYAGLTVEQIKVGPNADDMVNLLFTKAQAPLPPGTQLPNGHMTILVATVITDDEMQWSMTNGRDALLAKLVAAGVGQMSVRDRKSVLQ